LDESAEFEALIAGLRAGNPAAVATIERRYGPFLRAAVRRRLSPRLRSRFDSLDMVQDVWASFLALPPDRLTFASPQALLAFLSQVAFNRTVDVFRERCETRRELEVTAPDAGNKVPDPSGTPSMSVSAGEEWEKLVGQFPAGHRLILRRLQEGYDIEEIARMANVSVSTVNRVVRRLRELTGA
jgi:DNA-directed RNA polymerase specialized sigma24 family protein